VVYELAANGPPNHLHGGWVGFDKKLWSGGAVARADGADSVRLKLRSPDGDEGYPGNLDAVVTYTLTERNEFIFETELSTDEATPATLAHHSYFNLAGEGSGPITGHEIQIFADTYAPTNEKMTLLGRRESVEGRGCDLRQPRRIGDALPGIHKAHGDLYFVEPMPALAARVTEPVSGRVLEVSTTEDCLQFYSAASLDGSLRGKSGRPYDKYGGFCLECQGYADGANAPAMGNIIIRPGQPHRGTTVYHFLA
jgi:aldose 1-epimerase